MHSCRHLWFPWWHRQWYWLHLNVCTECWHCPSALPVGTARRHCPLALPVGTRHLAVGSSRRLQRRGRIPSKPRCTRRREGAPARPPGPPGPPVPAHLPAGPLGRSPARPSMDTCGTLTVVKVYKGCITNTDIIIGRCCTSYAMSMRPWVFRVGKSAGIHQNYLRP